MRLELNMYCVVSFQRNPYNNPSTHKKREKSFPVTKLIEHVC